VFWLRFGNVLVEGKTMPTMTKEDGLQEVAKMLGEAKAKLESLMGTPETEMGLLCETEHVVPNLMPDCEKLKGIRPKWYFNTPASARLEGMVNERQP
jgi:hypothetical protein